MCIFTDGWRPAWRVGWLFPTYLFWYACLLCLLVSGGSVVHDGILGGAPIWPLPWDVFLLAGCLLYLLCLLTFAGGGNLSCMAKFRVATRDGSPLCMDRMAMLSGWLHLLVLFGLRSDLRSFVAFDETSGGRALPRMSALSWFWCLAVADGAPCVWWSRVGFSCGASYG